MKKRKNARSKKKDTGVQLRWAVGMVKINSVFLCTVVVLWVPITTQVIFPSTIYIYLNFDLIKSYQNLEQNYYF